MRGVDYVDAFRVTTPPFLFLSQTSRAGLRERLFSERSKGENHYAKRCSLKDARDQHLFPGRNSGSDRAGKFRGRRTYHCSKCHKYSYPNTNAVSDTDGFSNTNSKSEPNGFAYANCLADSNYGSICTGFHYFRNFR